ncbi:MAG TPA: M23 family metallopeptidase [Candidatus Pelethocola excrementipullorum]|nr:M23 family metallopeptidase [Candidatus Pelethocola excrementipullorum]
MKSRQRTLRIMLSGILLMATLACGVYVYRYESNKQEEARIESAKEEEEKAAKEAQEKEELTEDANTDNAEAQVPTETPAVESQDNVTETQTQPEADAADVDADTTASDAVLPALDFNEGTLLNLPLSGEILIPYNMDNTVYFSTLDLYRCNPAVMIAAEIDTPVAVVANSQVASIKEDAVTGTTVTMDMGNGYQAVYGQLKDVNVEEGQTVASGTVIGSINAPTKYFTKEGTNLYFSLTKDGSPLDPSLYLPPETE